MRRSLYTVLRLTALLLALVAVALGFLVWRLQTSPLPLSWFTSEIERALSTADGQVRVVIGDTALRLEAGTGAPALVASEVNLIGPDDALLAALPEIEVSLSLPALLERRSIAAARIVARAPLLLLIRAPDGSIGLQSGGAGPVQSGFDFGALLGRLLARSDPADPMHYLQELTIIGGQVVFRDQITGTELQADHAALALQQAPGRLSGALDFRLQQPDGAAQIKAEARYAQSDDRVGFSADFANVRPPALAALAPAWPLADLALPLHGQVAGEVGLDGSLAPLRLKLSGGAGEIDLHEHLPAPLAVAALEMEGSATLSKPRLTIERAKLALQDGVEVTGQGEIEPARPRASLDLAAANVTLDSLRRYWPPDQGRAARAWVLENITTGRVPRLAARLDLAPEDFDRPPLRDEALAGSFHFDDLTVRYLDTMPPVAGLSGEARFTGRTLGFEVASGRSAGLTLTGGTATITGIGIPGRDTTNLALDAKVEGSVPDALALLDRPPLALASKLGFVPARTVGKVAGTMQIAMPLHRAVTEEEVKITADAAATEVAVKGFRDKLDLADGRLQITVGEDSAKVSGRVAIDGVPVEVEIREAYAEAAPGERRLRLRGTLDRALLARLAPDLPVSFEGTAPIDATLTETPDNLWIDLAVDLAPATLEWPAIAWRKPAEAPGELRAALALPESGPLQIKQVELTGGGLSAKGTVELAPDGKAIEAVDLPRFRLDDSDAAIKLRRSDEFGYDVSIDARTLDLDRLLAGLEGERPDAGDKGAFRVALDAERLFLGGLEATQVAADLVHGDDGWRSAEVTGQLGARGQLKLSLLPEAGGHRLRLDSDDAGGLLAALEQTRRIEGGKLRLNAQILQQKPRIAAHGTLSINDFVLRDAPLLARLLTVASFTGISNLLAGKGIEVERFRLPFDLQGKVLAIDRGRLTGSQLGLTVKGKVDFAQEQLALDGTIVPIYGINRLLGRLPVIGDFLTGSDGIGAFAVTYQVTGPTAAPEIVINPLSILAPGAIRELVNGLIGGGLEPPDLPEDDR